VAMIDFLYFGEANIYQENLDSFLAVAEELQLKGLMGSGAEREKEDNKPQPKKETTKQIQFKSIPIRKEETPGGYNFVDKIVSSPTPEGTVAVTDTVAADLQDLEDQIKSMMEPTGKTIYSGNRTRKIYICKVCGKEGDLTDIKRHIEAHHITGVSHTCNICRKTVRSRDALRQHKSTSHNNIT